MKLNLGAGPHAREGYVPVDRKLGSEVFPLAFGEECAEEIYASHVLEHFSHRETLDVLKDWARVLKPGGWLKVAVPDLAYAAQHTSHPHFEGWLMGGQIDEDDFHHAIFTKPKLERLMAQAGLTEIQPWKSEIQDCASLPVSLNLMGRKPVPHIPNCAPPERPQPKIACALSVPRVGFTDMWASTYNALAPWNIPIRMYRGVWWERSLQNTLEDFIAEGFEYAVTTDYDTTFTPPQFNSLLDFMFSQESADAVCAVQPQRGSGAAMFSPIVRNPNTPDLADVRTNEPVQISTGHFGLTLIRLARLKDIPKPWFWNQPGAGGSWRRDATGLVDADIHFWNQWRAHGRTLYMLPWVSIGHLECLVSKIDVKTGKNFHAYATDSADAPPLDVRRKEPPK